MIFKAAHTRVVPNQGYADPPLLRSGYLDIRYAQCAETKDQLKKNHIRSYRVFELWAGVQKWALWVLKYLQRRLELI